MDWSALPAPSARLRLAAALVDLVPEFGVSREALARASEEVVGDPEHWRTVFSDGKTEAVWFVSQVSDASMRAAFAQAPATGMARVIDTRFAQNRALKPFVRKIMQFDIAHPGQALARMQRTAKVMYTCLAQRRAPGFVRLAALNVVYTGLVFVWLFDRSPDDRRTKALTAVAMRALGL